MSVSLRSLPLVLPLLLAPALAGPPVAAATPVDESDRAFARRAGGSDELGRPDASAVARARTACEEAVRRDPRDVAARLALTEVLCFEGRFVLDDRRARRKAFERLADFAEETVAIVDPPATAPRRRPPPSGSRRAGDAAVDPQVVEAHFWAAVSWGLWGMSHGKAASGFKDVAGRIRDHAQVVRALDETHRDAGGLRLLGRLHAATPRVPMFTGWIDPLEGVRLLERACAISLADPRNPLFLAEALLDHVPERRDEALGLLRELASREPDPSQAVEQAEILGQARARLAAENAATVRSSR